MSRILLVNTLGEDFRGINVIALCTLSASLKARGDQVQLLDCSVPGDIAEKTRQAVRSFSPDWVGLNVMTTHQRKTSREVSRLVKNIGSIPVIAGGVAVSVEPQPYISDPFLDAICIGEGDLVVLDIAASSGIDQCATIPNLWVRGKGEEGVIMNPVRPLIEDIDGLPLIDLGIFHDSMTRYKAPYVALMANRGCPFDCSYCFNAIYKNLFPNSGKYVRFRDPSLVVEEMTMARSLFPARYIYFEDDTFTINDRWMSGLVDALAKVGFSFPFSINIRLEKINVELIQELMRFGLKSVRFGIESGDELLREKILKRPVFNADYILNAKKLYSLGLEMVSYNMYGLPFETESSFRKTIELNLKIKTHFTGFQAFKPYKGLPIRKLVEKEGLLLHEPEDQDDSKGSNVGLFVRSQCSEKTYRDYFRAMHTVALLVKKFSWLKDRPKCIYYMTVFFKSMIAFIPSGAINVSKKLRGLFLKS